MSALAALPAYTQSQLNARWHGTWISGDSQLVISADRFKTSEIDCRWVAARPVRSTVPCVAFYDIGVPKSQITALFDAAEREIRRPASDPAARFGPEDRKALLEDLAQNRKVLAAISEDTFRTVALDSTTFEGDCTSFYLLDAAHLYEVTKCPYPEANALRQFRRAR